MFANNKQHFSCVGNLYGGAAHLKIHLGLQVLDFTDTSSPSNFDLAINCAEHCKGFLK